MTQLTVPKIMDVLKLHYPQISYTLAVQLLSTAQVNFVNRTKLNPKVSILSMTGKTVVGETEASPLAITDQASVYTWNFFKDATVNTVKMSANTNVLFFTDIQSVVGGEVVNSYSIQINDDGSILFYDVNGDELTNFVDVTGYIYIHFIKMPANLTAAASSIPEIAGEYHEAIVHYVISDLYMLRTDMPMIDRLQASKHYRNRYEEAIINAKVAYNKRWSTLPTTGQQGEDFGSD